MFVEQPLLHLITKPVIEGQLARSDTAGPPIGQRLGGQCAIAHRGTTSALACPEGPLAPIPRPALRVVQHMKTVVVDLAFDRRGRPPQTFADGLQRLVAADTALDFDALRQTQPRSRSRRRRFDQAWFHPASVTQPANAGMCRHADRHTSLRGRAAISDMTPKLPNNRCQRWQRHNSTPQSQSSAVASTPRTHAGFACIRPTCAISGVRDGTRPRPARRRSPRAPAPRAPRSGPPCARSGNRGSPSPARGPARAGRRRG